MEKEKQDYEDNILKFGQIVYLKLWDQANEPSQQEENVLCSDGFFINYIFHHNFKSDPNVDFSHALFMILPPYDQKIQQELQQRYHIIKNELISQSNTF